MSKQEDEKEPIEPLTIDLWLRAYMEGDEWAKISYEINTEVEKKTKRINEYIAMTHNPEIVAVCRILKALSDGKPASWSQIKTKAQINQTTLNRKLKKLVQLGAIKRRVIPAFPPKSIYQLNPAEEEFPKYFRNLSKMLAYVEELQRKILILSQLYVYAREEPSMTQTLEKAAKGTKAVFERIKRDWDSQIYQDLRDNLTGNRVGTLTPETITISIGLESIILMSWYWTFCEVLKFPENRRLEAIQIVDEIMNKLQSTEESEKSRRLENEVLEAFRK